MNCLIKWLFLLVLFRFCTINCSRDNDYKIVCYYTNWAQYRPDPVKFFPQHIDPNLCTHIIFSFAKIGENLELQKFEWNDEQMYKKIHALKEINKDVKIMLAVGGWNHGSLLFSDMARSDRRRKNFVEKAVIFLRTHNFDGLDLDWEYPASRDTEHRPDDKVYFTYLCKDLSLAFEPHGLILSAAVAAGVKYIKASYEMNEIYKYLDFISLMAYDLHGSWDNVTGHNAPLYAHRFDKDRTLNVDNALQLWLDQVPPEKIVLGIATYGRSFKLREGFESCPLTDTPIQAAGGSGKYSREEGFLTYFEICEKLKESRWNYIWNDQQQVPYAYSNEMLQSSNSLIEWIGFDDVRSVEIKVKYAMENNLGGAMLWALDMDDFTGNFCNQGAYPILKVINHHLNSKYKIELPSYDIFWKLADDQELDKPKQEKDCIVSNAEMIDANGFSTSNNIFALLDNNVMQVYKFCQCKSDTQTIVANLNMEEPYSFKVDCNKKIVYSSLTEPVPNEEVNSEETKKKFYDHKPEKKKNSLWFLKFNSSSRSTCTFSCSNYFSSFIVLSFLFRLFY